MITNEPINRINVRIEELGKPDTVMIQCEIEILFAIQGFSVLNDYLLREYIKQHTDKLIETLEIQEKDK